MNIIILTSTLRRVYPEVSPYGQINCTLTASGALSLKISNQRTHTSIDLCDDSDHKPIQDFCSFISRTLDSNEKKEQNLTIAAYDRESGHHFFRLSPRGKKDWLLFYQTIKVDHPEQDDQGSVLLFENDLRQFLTYKYK